MTNDKAPVSQSAEPSELVQKLREGVTSCGLHDDNETEMFDVMDADETMFEAADTIEELVEALIKVVGCFDIKDGLSVRDEMAIKHATAIIAKATA